MPAYAVTRLARAEVSNHYETIDIINNLLLPLDRVKEIIETTDTSPTPWRYTGTGIENTTRGLIKDSTSLSDDRWKPIVHKFGDFDLDFTEYLVIVPYRFNGRSVVAYPVTKTKRTGNYSFGTRYDRDIDVSLGDNHGSFTITPVEQVQYFTTSQGITSAVTGYSFNQYDFHDATQVFCPVYSVSPVTNIYRVLVCRSTYIRPVDVLKRYLTRDFEYENIHGCDLGTSLVTEYWFESNGTQYVLDDDDIATMKPINGSQFEISNIDLLSIMQKAGV